ncbi:MAG: tyrosinase family protein [Myxococcota bacterium]
MSLVENPSSPDPALLWYSRAIGIMRQKRAFVDPRSWRFQAAIHDYDKTTDPYRSDTDPAPSSAVQARYFGQCQHSSWFFLPWHRMYLYLFERIVADAVVEAGGPAGWTLPYWDYAASDDARKLPWAFRQPTWPGGETNWLYVPQRAKGMNEGTRALGAADVDVAAALGMGLFSTSPTSADVEFGGPRVKNHDGGTYPYGGVEQSPHNNVHVAVGGGPKGFMYDPTTAGLDPIFWLHHCNIDRLWEVWVREAGRANPTEATWQTGVAFPFHDANGKPVTMTASQVVDTTALDYLYEGMTPLRQGGALVTTKPRRPMLLGATDTAFALPTALHEITIATDPSVRAAPAGPRAERVLLHLENLTAKDSPGAYDVYVNVPPGKSAADHPERRAGRIALFGARQENRRTRSHARDGFSFVLDISPVYRALRAAGAWDAARLRVTFEPVYEWSDAVTVGRVSVNVR